MHKISKTNPFLIFKYKSNTTSRFAAIENFRSYFYLENLNLKFEKNFFCRLKKPLPFLLLNTNKTFGPSCLRIMIFY